jgi:hypothetical protein
VEGPASVRTTFLIVFVYALKLSRYDKARQIKEAQDAYCGRALAGQWDHLGASSFPEDLQWEPLVAILRGQVKVTLADAKAAYYFDTDDLRRVCQVECTEDQSTNLDLQRKYIVTKRLASFGASYMRLTDAHARQTSPTSCASQMSSSSPSPRSITRTRHTSSPTFSARHTVRRPCSSCLSLSYQTQAARRRSRCSRRSHAISARVGDTRSTPRAFSRTRASPL